MEFQALKEIGLSDNEIKIYVELLKSGPLSAYDLSKRTSIYRVHVYDKVEQLIKKGLVSYVFQSSKKYFKAASPSKIKDYMHEKEEMLISQMKNIETILPELETLSTHQKMDTKVEVFNGKEGLKYVLKEIIKTKKDVAVTGINDSKYQKELPVFMKQYFRLLKENNTHERVITLNNKKALLFSKDIAKTTTYRFLDGDKFNPTNTFIFGNFVLFVMWGEPITSILIENEKMAQTYKDQFERLWKIAKISR